MDAMSTARDLPPLPLFRRSVEQARVPRQGNGDGAPTHEIDRQAVIIDRNYLHAAVRVFRLNVCAF
jgi:hypothetical protein